MNATTEKQGFVKSYIDACRAMTAKDRKNARATNWVFLLWLLTFGPASILLSKGMIPSGPLTYLAIAVPVIISVIGCTFYLRFLREADELERKVQLEALALGFGGGFVTSFGLSLFESAGYEVFTVIAPIGIMTLLYIVGILNGTRRYS